MNSNSRYWMTLAVALIAATAGCGGGAKPPVAGQAAPAANAPQGNAHPAAPIQPNAAPAQAANAGAATTGSPVAAEEESEPVPPNPDEFEINTDETVTEIAGEFVEPPPTPVDVVVLAPGLDSSTLEIVSTANVNAPNATVSPLPVAPNP
ncbi:MAG: hypothetical protein JWN70_1146, partial [Planctomycetaceae bacterium]|nr:hypothetical protein [Planctomycetaceae bacterium]